MRSLWPAALLALLALLALGEPAGAYPAKRSCGDPDARASRVPRDARTARKSAGRRRRRGPPPAGAPQNGPNRSPASSRPNCCTTPTTLPDETPEGATQTIAVVDAFDDPTAEADLAVYDKQFGLPACTSGNGCFKKVNQKGEAARCPKSKAAGRPRSRSTCRWPTRSARTAKCCWSRPKREEFSDLGAGVNAAVKLGATEISNSYGGTEEPARRRARVAPTTTTRGSSSPPAPATAAISNTPASTNSVGANSPPTRPTSSRSAARR